MEKVLLYINIFIICMLTILACNNKSIQTPVEDIREEKQAVKHEEPQVEAQTSESSAESVFEHINEVSAAYRNREDVKNALSVLDRDSRSCGSSDISSISLYISPKGHVEVHGIRGEADERVISCIENKFNAANLPVYEEKNIENIVIQYEFEK